jgi:hypothetical protein
LGQEITHGLVTDAPEDRLMVNRPLLPSIGTFGSSMNKKPLKIAGNFRDLLFTISILSNHTTP